MKSVWNDAGREPAIDDILADPLVHLVMARDRIGPDEVRRAIETARRRLAGRADGKPRRAA